MGAIYLDNTSTSFVCIHCGRCVDYCPHACLEMTATAATDMAKEVAS